MDATRRVRILAAGVLAGGFTAASIPALSTSAGASPPGARSKALFVQTDAAAGNRILVYARAKDGSVARVASYATGGAGGTAEGATADPLASQGGLALIDHGREMVAVNAGSDTVSLFSVDGTRLQLLQVIDSGGEFPASVASSGRTVAVLNAGGTGSVAEFRLRAARLVARPAQTRSLGLSNTNPPDYLHGAGQVGFTPDGRHLVITTKESTNSYEVFSVAGHSGDLGAAPVVTGATNPVPFGFVFDSVGHLVATEAGNSSVTTYTVNRDGTLTSLGSVSDGAQALCWISGTNGVFYGSNAGSGTISSFTVSNTGSPVLSNATAGTAHAGTTDSVIPPGGGYLYVESGGAGTLDTYKINRDGSLQPVETVWNLPQGIEGIAAT